MTFEEMLTAEEQVIGTMNVILDPWTHEFARFENAPKHPQPWSYGRPGSTARFPSSVVLHPHTVINSPLTVVVYATADSIKRFDNETVPAWEAAVTFLAWLARFVRSRGLHNVSVTP